MAAVTIASPARGPAGAFTRTDLAERVGQGRGALLRQARRMMRDRVAAEDAVQDAMVALRHLPDFRGEAQLSTWLYRVGANAVLMGMRRDRRAAERTRRAVAALPPGDNWIVGHAPVAESSDPRVDALLRALGALPEHYRRVVKLCDLDELPLDEVATSLGLTVGGVRTRRLRAQRMLRIACAARDIAHDVGAARDVDTAHDVGAARIVPSTANV